jgi:hypothetical protein
LCRGHCALGILNGFLGLLKISLEASLHYVFGHLSCFFSFLGFFASASLAASLAFAKAFF